MKASALVPVVAVLAVGIGFYAGVKVGETRRLREPAPESIGAENQRTFFEAGERYQGVGTHSIRPADFRELTSYAGRRNTDR